MAESEDMIDVCDDLGIESFFEHVLNRTEGLLNENSNVSGEHRISTHFDLLERTVRLLAQLARIDKDETDLKLLGDLRVVFSELLEKFLHHFGSTASYTSQVITFPSLLVKSEGPGRPQVHIPPEVLEELRGLGFTWQRIASMFKVSRWTIMRRVRLFELENLSLFSSITDEEIDDIIRDYIARHGSTTGESYLRGYFRALEYTIQRRRIRESLNRVDPRNTALRWGALVSRKVYFVPWPNSLWHLDGHHSLIRWGFIIHGCIDGYSRRIIFLHCSTNNLTSTVLGLFESAVERDGGLWPSRIRVDYGVENTAVCDAMVAVRGEGWGSFITGSSTRNQRIERLWRDVFRCICRVFYYIFYAMEQTGVLDVENPIHMFTLQYVYLARRNNTLSEWMVSFNDHPVQTEHSLSPNQMWLNGMMHPCNPLANGSNDVEPEDMTLYGEDSEAPIPTEESNNNVEVFPASNNNDELVAYLTTAFDPLQESSSLGVDIYAKALEIVVHKLEQEH